MIAVGVPVASFGQAAPPPKPAAAPDEVVILTPFEVDASKNTRYAAVTTLAGSRLNSELKNIPSTIDVYTKDFLDDIAATDLASAMNYANGYEQGDDTSAGNQSGVGNGNTEPRLSTFRVRGLNASIARNYFNYDYPLDTYNIERLDESRGPNAILFGFGSPGGIINSSTKKAQLDRSFLELSATAGNLIQNRTVVDANQVVLKNQLAVRLNLLHQEKTGWRTYTFDDRDGFELAVTLRPTKKTIVEVEYETFVVHDEPARPGTYWTQNTTWDAAGKPLVVGNFANRTNAAQNPGLNGNVLAQLSGSTYWVYNEQNGSLANWRNMSRSNIASFTGSDGMVYTNIGDFRTMQLTPKGILGVNPIGPSFDRKLDLGQFFARVQQNIAKNLDLEIAATRQRSYWWSYRIVADTLTADPNAQLPAGGAASTGPAATAAANPFAGKSYIEGGDQYWITKRHTGNYRAALSYELDLGKWFGRHRLGALWEDDNTMVYQQQLEEAVFVNGKLTSPIAHNAQNQLFRRHYIMESANPRDYHYANTRIPAVPLDVTLADGSRLTSSWVNYANGPDDYTKDDKSWMFVAQSSWWADRINTVIGIRRDTLKFDSWGNYVDGGQGAYVRSPASRTVTTTHGKTQNYGIVFHPTRWLSLVANSSDSLGLVSTTLIVPDGHPNDPTQGKGRDYGLRISLPNRRLEASVTYFESWSKNIPGGTNINAWGVGGPNNILDALISAGFLTQTTAMPFRTYGGADTLDQQSKGVEVGVSGQITLGWDMRLNYSHTDRITTNGLLRIQAWAVSTLRPFWATFDRPNPNEPQRGNILDTVFNGGSSIRSVIQNFESNLVNRKIGDEAIASVRPNKFNFFTTYAFRSESFAKGLRLGGGLRYESPIIIGQDQNDHNFYGNSHTSVDLMAAYSREVWQRRWTFQVNVNNAFRDEPTYSPAVMNTARSGPATIVIYPPQEIICTLRVKL
jgi:outer membrane receptor for ferric coprogen and ferric-rhodotorulic acid